MAVDGLDGGASGRPDVDIEGPPEAVASFACPLFGF